MQAENPIYVISFSLSENGEGEEQNRTDGRRGKMNIPRIMIAAAGSGSGKTLLSCALMMLFSQEGKSVSAIKCGPDYIDPMFHRTVLGVPSRNLDTFFHWERMTKSLFARAAEGADLCGNGGVMGLYDGLGGIRKEDRPTIWQR